MSERWPLAVVLVRQREAWRRGEPLRVEQLLEGQAHLAGDDDAVLDLIYSERLLREEGGQPAPLEEYETRFPRLAAPLRAMFEVDEALSAEAAVETPRQEAYNYSTVDTPAGQPVPGEPAPQLDGLEMLGELGRGAMGVVYRGWQKSARRPVAVKVLDSDVPVARARTEAEAAARLTHPNIAQTYEVRQHGERTVLVLEYVEGGNLAQKIAGRPQPPRDAARFVEVLAWAMAYAHARGVIHRDLKPSNVLLSAGPDAPLAQCVPKISDFGLAKLIEGGLDVTRSNEMLGTPSYMPPEQASGGGGRITAATDVWALGAILYELLTGRAPFLGEGLLETINQVLHQDPVPPSGLQPTVAHDLEVITLKCLHKAPARRYESARELADDLKRFQAGEPIRARPVGPGERAWKWARRHPTAALLLGVALLAGAAALAAGVRVNQIVRGQRDLARDQARELEEQLHNRRHLLHTAHLLRVGSVWPLDPEQGLLMLEDEQAFPHGMRCFSWWVLRNQCQRYRERLVPTEAKAVTALAQSPKDDLQATATAAGEVLLWRPGERVPAARFKAHEGRVTALAFRGDGRLLASGGQDGQVGLWEISGKLAGRLTAAGPVAALAWHPDGRNLAVSGARATVPSEGQVAFYDTRALRKGRIFTARTHPLGGVAVSPDGTALACAGSDHAVLIFAARTGVAWAPRPGHDGAVTCLLFAADGQSLYTGARDGTVRSWSLQSDAVNERDSLDAAVGPVAAMALHPRRPVLAVAGEGAELASDDMPLDVQLLDLTARARLGALRGHVGATGVSFSADGARLTTAGADGSLKRWDYPGRPAHVPLGGRSAAVAVARDAALVAWQARGDRPGQPAGVYVRDLAGGAERLVAPAESNRPFQALALSPDGKLLATSAGLPEDPPDLLIQDVATRRVLHAPRGHLVGVTALVFSPDGKRLISAARDGQVRVWAVTTGEAERALSAPAKPALAVAVSGDGQRVAVAGGDPSRVAVIVWELADGREVARLAPGRGGFALALDREGRLLALAERGGAVRLVEVDTGSPREPRAMGMNEVSCVAFSADGATLAVAGSGAGVRLWDVATWQERASLPGHRGGAVFAGFAAKGDVLLTATDGGLARLWYRAPLP